MTHAPIALTVAVRAEVADGARAALLSESTKLHARTASPKRKATRLSTAAPHRAEPAYPSVAVADGADAKGAALDEDATGGDAHLKLRMVPRTSTSAKRGGSARQVGEECNI